MIAQTASHYMDDIFPDPFQFDIDHYLSPRLEHNSPGHAPYGLGTYRCLGSRWMELQLTVDVLMGRALLHPRDSPRRLKLKFNALPSMKPSKKLKFRIVERRNELSAR
jgi:cytochrome P450